MQIRIEASCPYPDIVYIGIPLGYIEIEMIHTELGLLKDAVRNHIKRDEEFLIKMGYRVKEEPCKKR